MSYLGLDPDNMKNDNYNGSTCFLEIGCNCGCSKKILREKFTKLCEAFQALSRSEQDIFLMAQLKAMNGLPADV